MAGHEWEYAYCWTADARRGKLQLRKNKRWKSIQRIKTVGGKKNGCPRRKYPRALLFTIKQSSPGKYKYRVVMGKKRSDREIIKVTVT